MSQFKTVFVRSSSLIDDLIRGKIRNACIESSVQVPSHGPLHRRLGSIYKSYAKLPDKGTALGTARVHYVNQGCNVVDLYTLLRARNPQKQFSAKILCAALDDAVAQMGGPSSVPVLNVQRLYGFKPGVPLEEVTSVVDAWSEKNHIQVRMYLPPEARQ